MNATDFTQCKGLTSAALCSVTKRIYAQTASRKNKESTADEITKPEQKAQIMSADFSKLTKSTNNDELKSLYEYFDSEEPSYTNEYTGMFKGYNIIFITAESFSQYAIDKDLTPDAL